jgi:hypothetical protein
MTLRLPVCTGSNPWGDSMRRWATSSRLIIYLLIGASFSFFAQITAQTTTSGGLTGVITDQTNAVVPNADVDIKNLATGTTQSTKTDREGLYRFFFIAPGSYRLAASHEGFRQELRRVEVLLGPPVTVNIELQIATATSEIKVTDEVPLIHADNGDVSATLEQQQVSELPNQGNDLTNIAQLAPGAVMNTDNNFGAAFSILGMPGVSYLYTMDGMNTTDSMGNLQSSGSLSLTLGQNLVDEATVVTTGYSGQFGGAAGGNINYVTKSGTGQFHGNAQYWYNNRVLNANNWFNKANGSPRPLDTANQWAGSLGGPIKREKLFFFFDNEGLRVSVPQYFFDIHAPSPEFEDATLKNIANDSRFGQNSATYSFYRKMFSLYDAASSAHPTAPGVTGDPTGLGCGTFLDPNDPHGPGHDTVPCTVHFNEIRGRPSQDMLTSGRVDWNVSNRDRAFLRLQYEGGRSAIFLDAIDPVFDADASLPWWQGQILETHTFGSSGASQFLLAGSSGLASYKMRNPSEALSTMPTGLHFGCCEGFNDLGQSGFFNPLGSVFGVPLRYQISEDVLKSWHTHKFGFGVSFETIHWHLSGWSYSSNVIGTLQPQSLDAFYWGGFDPNSSSDFTLLFQSFPLSLSQRMAFYNYGLYGQDEWHAWKNLSLTFSLRAEHKANPTCEQACFARFNGPFESVSHDANQPYNQALVTSHHAFTATDTVLWSPRFSFAWQPFGVSHTTVLRGGVGIFYDSNPGYLAFLLSNGIPFVNSYVVSNDNLAPGETPSNLFDDAAASNSAFVNGYKSGQTLAQIQAATSQINGAVFSPPAITVPDTPAHAPQFQKWSLELQQALGTHSSFDVGYFGHHGIHGLVQNPSANAWGFGSLPAGFCTSPPVPPCADPRFSQVGTFRWGAISNYNGLVASFQHKFSRWTSGLVQFNYTFGHTLDEVSDGGLFGFTGGGTIYPPDVKNLRRSYGPAEYDVRHSINANYVWELPLRAALGGRGPSFLVRGWQVSGTVFFHTGFPYSVFDAYEAGVLQAKNYFGPVYAVPAQPLGPDPYCGSGAGFVDPVHPCQPPQLEDGNPNPNARFVQAGCETGFDQGTLPGTSDPCGGSVVVFAQGRNRFRGPSYFNTDFTIMKNTKLPRWENASLGLGVQFFNVFNHPSFGLPSNNIDDFGFGWIFGGAGPYTNLAGNNTGGDSTRRLIQLKAQIRF